jgi:hypothetical protein
MEYRVNALIVLSMFRTVTSWLRLPYATNVNNVIASFSTCLSHSHHATPPQLLEPDLPCPTRSLAFTVAAQCH